MTTKKPSFIEYILSRWPIIMLGIGIAYWVLTAIYDLKEEVHTITLLTSKDKEAIDTRFTAVESMARNADNKANENEKQILWIKATLPDRVKIKEQ